MTEFANAPIPWHQLETRLTGREPTELPLAALRDRHGTMESWIYSPGSTALSAESSRIRPTPFV